MTTWTFKSGTAEICEEGSPSSGHVWFTRTPLDFVDLTEVACLGPGGSCYPDGRTFYFVTDIEGAELGEWSYEYTGSNPSAVLSNFSSTYMGSGVSGSISCGIVYTYGVPCSPPEGGSKTIYSADFDGVMSIYFELGENRYGPITLTTTSWEGPCEVY